MSPSELNVHTTVSPGYPNTPEVQFYDLKSQLIKMIEDFTFKEKTNKSFKGIQQGKIKKVKEMIENSSRPEKQ